MDSNRQSFVSDDHANNLYRDSQQDQDAQNNHFQYDDADLELVERDQSQFEELSADHNSDGAPQQNTSQIDQMSQQYYDEDDVDPNQHQYTQEDFDRLREEARQSRRNEPKKNTFRKATTVDNRKTQGMHRKQKASWGQISGNKHLDNHVECTDNDLQYIEDLIEHYFKALNNQEPTSTVTKNMLLELLSQEEPLEEQDIDDALDEVRQLSLNFRKVLESSCILIDKARQGQEANLLLSQTNNQLEQQTRFVKDQVDSIKEEWRKDQVLRLKAEEEAEKKEQKIDKLQKVISDQKMIIDNAAMEADTLSRNKSELSNSAQEKLNQRQSSSQFQRLKNNYKSKQEFEELEKILEEKSDALNQALYQQSYLQEQLKEAQQIQNDYEQEQHEMQNVHKQQESDIQELLQEIDHMRAQLESQEAIVKEYNEKKINKQMTMMNNEHADDTSSFRQNSDLRDMSNFASNIERQTNANNEFSGLRDTEKSTSQMMFNNDGVSHRQYDKVSDNMSRCESIDVSQNNFGARNTDNEFENQLNLFQQQRQATNSQRSKRSYMGTSSVNTMSALDIVVESGKNELEESGRQSNANSKINDQIASSNPVKPEGYKSPYDDLQGSNSQKQKMITSGMSETLNSSDIKNRLQTVVDQSNNQSKLDNIIVEDIDDAAKKSQLNKSREKATGFWSHLNQADDDNLKNRNTSKSPTKSYDKKRENTMNSSQNTTQVINNYNIVNNIEVNNFGKASNKPNNSTLNSRKDTDKSTKPQRDDASMMFAQKTENVVDIDDFVNQKMHDISIRGSVIAANLKNTEIIVESHQEDLQQIDNFDQRRTQSVTDINVFQSFTQIQDDVQNPEFFNLIQEAEERNIQPSSAVQTPVLPSMMTQINQNDTKKDYHARNVSANTTMDLANQISSNQRQLLLDKLNSGNFMDRLLKNNSSQLKFDGSLMSPMSGADISTSTRNQRKQPIRKEPELEFFHMTLLAKMMVMTHPNKNILISNLASQEDKLFKQCRKQSKKFFDWPNWIDEELKKIVTQTKSAIIQNKRQMKPMPNTPNKKTTNKLSTSQHTKNQSMSMPQSSNLLTIPELKEDDNAN